MVVGNVVGRGGRQRARYARLAPGGPHCAPTHAHTPAHCAPHARAQVRIKLKHMEIEIRRKEVVGSGVAAHSEVETLAKYEIMDGAPVRGESVPIRCARGV